MPLPNVKAGALQPTVSRALPRGTSLAQVGASPGTCVDKFFPLIAGDRPQL